MFSKVVNNCVLVIAWNLRLLAVLDLMRMMLLHPQCAIFFANATTAGNGICLFIYFYS